MDIVQGALSFVGLVPGIGVAADVVNAAISLGRGNYGAADSQMESAMTNAAFYWPARASARSGRGSSRAFPARRSGRRAPL